MNPFASSPLVLLALVLPVRAFGPLQTEKVHQSDLERMTEEIKADIERLRERPFPRAVTVGLADTESFRAYVKERLDRSTTPEEIASQEMIAKLMGMIPADMDLLATTMGFIESQVGGFYDPATESFRLMETFTGGLAKVILAHELTHALDDQLYDLDGSMDARKGNSDRLTAYQGVVEGSGTALMNAWTMAHLRELSAEDLSQGGLGLEGLEDTPPFLWRPLLGVYLRGAAFLVRTENMMAGQTQVPALSDLERAFLSPPESTEQLLHPAKYWEEGQLDVPVPLELKLRRLPEGWTLLHEDTVGELGLASFIEPLSRRGGLASQSAVLGAAFTYGPAAGWGGDRVALLGKGQARYLRLETIWDDAEEAAEFELALAYLEEHLRAAGVATAAAVGLEGSGLLVERKQERVTFSAWVGVGDDELKALGRGIRVR